LLDCLNFQANLQYKAGNITAAKATREEAYIYVSKIHNPEHPLVLQAGSKLIEILGATGDDYNAERFARVCYDALTRPPLDPESYEAMNAARIR
jgi:hypothetical protein